VDDTLSEVMRGVRLKGAVFFSVEASGRWVAEASATHVIRPRLMPSAEHLIEYHVMSSGTGFAYRLGEAPVRLAPGDVVAFPRGDAHAIASAPDMRGGPDAETWLSQRSRVPNRIRIGSGGGETAAFICGFLGSDAGPFNPLLSALPPMIHLRAGDEGEAHRRAMIDVALAEAAAPRPGSDCVLARVSELLFIEIVRAHVGALAPDRVGWLAGLRDDTVGRALGRLHAEPARDWTLEELARAAGVSRTILAERFTRFVGIPPIQYLAQWRVQLAANLLRSSAASLAEIAARVGYGSEGALSRAFKRVTGLAPTDYRRPVPG